MRNCFDDSFPFCISHTAVSIKVSIAPVPIKVCMVVLGMSPTGFLFTQKIGGIRNCFDYSFPSGVSHTAVSIKVSIVVLGMSPTGFLFTQK